MIKSILVPFGGGGSDTMVFSSAVTLGRCFGAHLDFYHVDISAGEAAVSTPGAGFAMGDGLRELLATLQSQAETRTALARSHFESLCATEQIRRVDTPALGNGLSAAWVEDSNHAQARLMARSRCRDLVIAARPHLGDGVPRDLLEVLVLGCGRPVIIVLDDRPLPAPNTILICWKDCAQTARADGSALPLLKDAQRVVVASVEEDSPASGLTDFTHQLAWHGITPDVLCMAKSKTPVSQVLLATAQRVGADLMVMGAYRRSPLREVVFGGVTQDILEKCDVGVLLAH